MKIAFGALSPKLHAQLGASPQRFRFLQDYADSIVKLKIGGILTDAEAVRARRRLMLRIVKIYTQRKPR